MSFVVVRSSFYPGDGMFVVRDVWEFEPPKEWVEGEFPKLLRVEWSTPGGWVPGEEGGVPPRFEPWQILGEFCRELVGDNWAWNGRDGRAA